MAQISSGKILKETRERKGYDLSTVARRLRIRPDILRAIESNDFSAMPPRGYARNMVNAYARLLGLNPSEIVNMYLDEAYAHQVEQARTDNIRGSIPLDHDRRHSAVTRRPQRSSSYGEGTGSVYGDLESPDFRSDQGSRISRHLYDDRTQYSRDDYGVTRQRVAREGHSERDFMSHHSGYPSSSFSIYDDSRQVPRRRQVHVGVTPNEYSAPRLPSFLQSRASLIIIAILVVIIVLFLIFFVFGRGSDSDPADVGQLPVSGISDTTGDEDSEEEEELNVEVAPTSARIVLKVAEGDSCYIEYYDDTDTPTAELLTGPVEKTIETTGTWTITTFAPDLIEVLVNGEKVTLEVSEDYSGMYAYTVDFPTILEQWRSTHTSRGSQRQAAVASAANAAANEKSTGSSSGSSSDSSADPDASQGTNDSDLDDQ